MRISTKYAPRKTADGKPLSCTTETTLKPEQMLELYRYLKLTRLVEERLVNLYRQTKVVGGVFRSLGQEATAVGTAYALAAAGFHHAVDSRSRRGAGEGNSPARNFRAVHGESLGTIRRPRSQHSLRRHGERFHRSNLASRRHDSGDDRRVARRAHAEEAIVAIAYIGDGGMSTGAFHEGLNFAAVQRLPLIVVAEHNHYAYSTPTSLQTAVQRSGGESRRLRHSRLHR